MEKLKANVLPVLIALSALSVSGSAAFYSVSGLSKLFAGASFAVILMSSSLEISKLVIASLLYQYWDTINKWLRTYLASAVVILVLITSMGIYGFLSAAYQDTYRQLTIKENQISFLDQKKKFYEKDVARYDEELERISNNISTLSNAKASSIQVRDTTSSTGLRSTVSTAELRLSQKRIEVEEENRKGVQSKREVASDSLQGIQLQILDLESMEGVSSELGPLEYLSGLLDRPMDVIINWFILIIIFVFDPLAVALVIAFNNAVMVDRGIVKKEKVIRKRELYDETPDDDSDDETPLEEIEVKELLKVKPLPKKRKPKKKKEYDVSDLDKDGIVTEEEKRKYYESTGWKNSYEGNPYYQHPWFDWKKKERWINDRDAINYWLKVKGGNRTALDKFKSEYPTDFNSKTY